MPNPTAHHVGITVSDLDRAVTFYRDEIGLEVLTRFSVAGEAFADAVDIPGATGAFAHLDADGARVELIEYDPEGTERGQADLNQPGAVHLGLSVEDVDEFFDGLRDDVDILSAPQTTSSGTRILFVRDPEGNLIEILDA